MQFATCERKRALEFIKKVYPSRNITDTEDCAKPLLDFVEKDIVRIQDPMMHGNRIKVITGRHWNDEVGKDAIQASCNLLHTGQ